MNILDRIKKIASDSIGKTIENRRYIHANPELSFQEYNTQKFVKEKLAEIGINATEIANTGLVAHIEGKNPNKKIVALRADMDALPIIEENNVPYKSTNNGVMHACGHDVHTSSLLGTAHILNELKTDFEGTVKLVFQPGEERAPGGASVMIKEGVLKNPAPQSMLGQHVMPLLPVGKIGFREGLYMASADELYITIKGKGGHGAMPHLGVDPVLITSHIIIALQQIVSRNADPKTPTVLSFGKVIANGATNVIPNSVYVEGTFRTMDEKWRADALVKMKKMAETMAEAMGGICEFNIVNGYPFLVNNPEVTKRARLATEAYIGKENIIDLDIWMAAEDFAYYSHEVDACFYRLGTRNEDKGIISGVHTPTFDIDENALELSTGLMAWMAIKELGN